jgi:hypothetical protein
VREHFQQAMLKVISPSKRDEQVVPPPAQFVYRHFDSHIPNLFFVSFFRIPHRLQAVRNDGLQVLHPLPASWQRM